MAINYQKQTYVNGSGATPLSAERLNHNENGTKAVADAVDQITPLLADGGRLSETGLSTTIAGVLGASYPATQGSNLVGYGPSYMAGVRASDPALSFFKLVAESAGFATSENRAVSGATGIENAYDALTDINGFGWAPRTDGGVVLVEPNINCVQLFGPNPKGFAAAVNATRTLVALLRSRARISASAAAFAYTGVWSAAAGAINGGADARSTTDADATATFSFVGDEATLILHAKDGDAGGTVYGPIAVSVDGGPEKTYTLTDQALSYVPGSSGSRYGSPIVYAPFPVRVAGLAHGPHTIRVRNMTAGRAVVVREALLPAATPPGVVLIADAPRPDWSSSTAGGNNTVLAQYNQQLWRVADEFGGPIAVADPTLGWVNATMSDIATHDGKHPSNLGHAHYAASILPRMRALGFSAAWTGWKSGDGWDGSTPDVPTPVLSITDNFSGGQANIVGRTTTTGGKVWAVSGGTTVETSAGGIAKTSGGSGNSNAYIPIADTDHAVEATVTAVPSTVGSAIGGLVVRADPASQDGIFLQIRESGSIMGYTITKRVGGTSTVVQATGVAPVVGDRIRLEVIGSTVRALRNGSQIASANITDLATRTDAGLYFNRSDNGTFGVDDFAAEAL